MWETAIRLSLQVGESTCFPMVIFMKEISQRIKPMDKECLCKAISPIMVFGETPNCWTRVKKSY